MEKLINRLVSEYLRERGFAISEGPDDEIWTKKEIHKKILIRGTTIILCKPPAHPAMPGKQITIDLYQPDSLQEIAAILYVCHGIWGDCGRCTIPTIKKKNLAELNKLVEELK